MLNRKTDRNELQNNAFLGEIFRPIFSGKEKDPETGYHYFGARYYNSDLSLWLSVDPMSDKYPSLSPYNYCAWNPMKIVDPNGRDTIFANDQARRLFNNVYNKLSCRYRELENKSKLSKSQKTELSAIKKIKESFDAVIRSNIKVHYDVKEADKHGSCSGKTYGKPGIDGISVDINSLCEGTLVHETRHASGVIKGEIDFDYSNITSDGVYKLLNYDLQDEFEAYRQGHDYSYYINKGMYYDDNRIKNTYIDNYIINSSIIGIIPEYVQYNSRSNPYKK